jgi:DNA-binding NarL/FixJ family response regulator
VKTHVGRVLAKVGARNRIQAVILAYDLRLTRPN